MKQMQPHLIQTHLTLNLTLESLPYTQMNANLE